ncbi:hypothetical protein HHL11_14535 [Ramlibacter sp. G-1-2-2]|uniref:Uncharacterized protein n=1 Tax=Ramlibacter agri TaxID=2728837 RepID=A0A848H587_9BURK|nr:hypothetical protein [Ramlibacter agri]NML44972.1 hypothetical protein [Ramlibacter agri]
MGMFDGKLTRWLGKPEPQRGSRASGSSRPAPAHSTQFAASQSRDANTSQHGVRKEVLKVVMRETLHRNGIPESWLSADLLRTASPRREPGIHVRMLVKHWDPRILQHGVALEQEFYRRLLGMDPLAANWLMGFSWQFAMEDLSRCPPLPHPGSWTAPQATDTLSPDDKPTTRAGDIIEGPVMIPKSEDDVRADLERLLALRDDDMKRHGPSSPDGFAPTRPVQL